MNESQTIEPHSHPNPDDDGSATMSSALTRNQLRASALEDGDERDHHLVKHPLNRRPIDIPTKAIEDALLRVCEAVAYRHLGLCFIAKYRQGKTTASSMIAENIGQVVQNLAVHNIVARSHDAVKERVFYGDLCESLGLSKFGTAEERADRVQKGVQSACLKADSDQFLLIVDEGQAWGVKEYEWLRDTSNVLNQKRYTLTTVIFGDPRLMELSSQFRQSRQDLWARFLMKPTPFSGVRSKEDLQFFLSQLDNVTQCEYPVGSGVSYSEFFLPKAYAAEWRLEGEATSLWNALVRGATSVNRKIEEVGMQWVSDAVIDFLKRAMETDSAGFASGSDEWDMSVAAARFVDALV
jgi:type II secretory pathway predicted ATPase ExeA